MFCLCKNKSVHEEEHALMKFTLAFRNSLRNTTRKTLFSIFRGGNQMATGWADDGAVNDQIRDSVLDEVMRARNCLPDGEGTEYCTSCGELIPEARRKALPGVHLCVECQEEEDREQRPVSLYNRRGSKDSQLR